MLSLSVDQHLSVRILRDDRHTVSFLFRLRHLLHGGGGTGRLGFGGAILCGRRKTLWVEPLSLDLRNTEMIIFYHHILYTQAHKRLEPIIAILGWAQCYTVLTAAPLNHSLVYLGRVNYNWGCKEEKTRRYSHWWRTDKMWIRSVKNKKKNTHWRIHFLCNLCTFNAFTELFLLNRFFREPLSVDTAHFHFRRRTEYKLLLQSAPRLQVWHLITWPSYIHSSKHRRGTWKSES